LFTMVFKVIEFLDGLEVYLHLAEMRELPEDLAALVAPYSVSRERKIVSGIRDKYQSSLHGTTGYYMVKYMGFMPEVQAEDIHAAMVPGLLRDWRWRKAALWWAHVLVDCELLEEGRFEEGRFEESRCARYGYFATYEDMCKEGKDVEIGKEGKTWQLVRSRIFRREPPDDSDSEFESFQAPTEAALPAWLTERWHRRYGCPNIFAEEVEKVSAKEYEGVGIGQAYSGDTEGAKLKLRYVKEIVIPRVMKRREISSFLDDLEKYYHKNEDTGEEIKFRIEDQKKEEWLRREKLASDSQAKGALSLEAPLKLKVGSGVSGPTQKPPLALAEPHSQEPRSQAPAKKSPQEPATEESMSALLVEREEWRKRLLWEAYVIAEWGAFKKGDLEKSILELKILLVSENVSEISR
jgi:hypothetical protein